MATRTPRPRQPLSRVEAVAWQFREQLLVLERGLAERIAAGHLGDLKLLEAQAADLASALRKRYLEQGVIDYSWLSSQTKFNALLMRLKYSNEDFLRFAAREIDKQRIEMVYLARKHAEQLVSATAVGETGLLQAWRTIPVSAVAEMVGVLQPAATTTLGQINSPVFDVLARYGEPNARRIGEELIKGVVQGRGPRATARRIAPFVQQRYSKSMVIARTETLRAYRESKRAAWQQNPSIVTSWVWYANLGSCCGSCMAMHGTKHDMDESMGSHPNCFPAGTRVAGPPPVGSVERWFDGDLVDLVTRGGRSLSVTPNHPILTARGWIPAGDVEKGDYLVSGSGGQRMEPSINPDDEQVPSLIEDVATSLGRSGGVSPRVVPTTAVDFHGDGLDAEICVVRTDGLLGDAVDASIEQPFGQEMLVVGDTQAACLSCGGPLTQRLETVALSASGSVRSGNVGGSFLGGPSARQETVGGSLPAWFDAVSEQQSADDVASDPVRLSDSILRFARDVSLDDVIEIRRYPWSGHVYNLETNDGWYMANTIIVHNCRCVMLPVTPTFADLGFDGIDDEDVAATQSKRADAVYQGLSDGERAARFGKSTSEALRESGAPRSSLSVASRSKDWGVTRREATAAEIRRR